MGQSQCSFFNQINPKKYDASWLIKAIQLINNVNQVHIHIAVYFPLMTQYCLLPIWEPMSFIITLWLKKKSSLKIRSLLKCQEQDQEPSVMDLPKKNDFLFLANLIIPSECSPFKMIDYNLSLLIEFRIILKISHLKLHIGVIKFT